MRRKPASSSLWYSGHEQVHCETLANSETLARGLLNIGRLYKYWVAGCDVWCRNRAPFRPAVSRWARGESNSSSSTPPPSTTTTATAPPSTTTTTATAPLCPSRKRRWPRMSSRSGRQSDESSCSTMWSPSDQESEGSVDRLEFSVSCHYFCCFIVLLCTDKYLQSMYAHRKKY